MDGWMKRGREKCWVSVTFETTAFGIPAWCTTNWAMWPTGSKWWVKNWKQLLMLVLILPLSTAQSSAQSTGTTTTNTPAGQQGQQAAVPPPPQFSYQEINVASLAGLAPHIQVNAQVRWSCFPYSPCLTHLFTASLLGEIRCWSQDWFAHSCAIWATLRTWMGTSSCSLSLPANPIRGDF